MQPNKNRILLLLGAGAVIPWKAPKTKDLTKIISNYIPDNDTFQTKNGKPVGEHLINLLNEYFTINGLVNFETLIDVIESICNYYDLIEREGGENLSIKSYIPAIFQIKKEIEEIFSFSDYDVIYNENYGENNLKRIYLIKIFKEYLSIIKEEVVKYSNNFDNENYNKINSDLKDFLSSISENKKNIIRTYTLNYDNFLPKVCKDFNFFNGFNDKEKIKHSSSLADDYLDCSFPDIESIVNNRVCNSYFNLHGSVFF